MEKAIKKKLAQIILRIDDEHGHHIIRKEEVGWLYTMEGYKEKPENYQSPPSYYFPLTEDEVKNEFTKQGKEWRR